MPPRFQFARRKAEDLIRSVGVTSAPVPIEKIAKKLGAELRFEPFEGELSGMVHRPKKTAAIIGINSLHPKTRQRFTIAHEIAHLVLHSDEEFHVDNRYLGFRNDRSSQAIDDREIEANQFAAALLMPQTLVFSDVGVLPDDIEPEQAVEELAAKYQVSQQAMTIRLHALGILE